jgi:hypothetical protein
VRIISKFKDYYDGVSGQYFDKEIIYLRESQDISVKRDDFPRVQLITVRGAGREPTGWTIGFDLIGFCGEIFPVVKMHFQATPTSPVTKAHSFYNFQEFEEFVRGEGLPIEYDKYSRKWYYFSSYEASFDSVARFFENKDKFEKAKELFVRWNVPAFVIKCAVVDERKTVITLNPVLKDYSFARVKDPFTAHQDLYSFVSGRLNQPVREMVTVSDAVKIHKHGFDKWSFRKYPEKK